ASGPLATRGFVQLPSAPVRGWSTLVRVNTTLGMSFIAGANGVVAVGQYVAQPTNDLCPTAWPPAFAMASTVHAFDSGSDDSNTQSFSPFGPPTNPSTDIDIFRISFRIARSFISRRTSDG